MEITKTSGNKYFTEEKFHEAIRKYEKVLRYLEEVTADSEDQTKRFKALQFTCHSNMAACYLREKKNADALKACEKVPFRLS